MYLHDVPPESGGHAVEIHSRLDVEIDVEELRRSCHEFDEAIRSWSG